MKAYYPEGPLVCDKGVFFVEYTKNRIIEYDSGLVFELPVGMNGPCSLAYYNGEVIVACYDSHLIYFTQSWKIYDIPYPNDMIVDEYGGVFITSSGVNDGRDPFDPEVPASGSIYYLSVLGDLCEIPTRQIHMANGIALYKNRLSISEHLQNRVISFTIIYDTSGLPCLSQTSEHILDLPRWNASKLLGPDGLYYDFDGNLYIAHYGSGKLLKYDNQYSMVKYYKFEYANITNVALSECGKSAYVTIANHNLKLRGSVINILL
jgi:sugar lactone lactonase YvrE